MSDQISKSTPPKKQGLGRGLGSLLGHSEEGAFSKATSSPASAVTDRALASLTEQFQRNPMPPHFIETPKAQDLMSTPAEVPALAPAAPSIPSALRVWNIAIEKIIPNPKQPRQIFQPGPLQELANSIQEKGIIQPLLLRKKGEDQFEIIAGERRWRAAQLAGLKEVPCLVKETEDQEVLELALIENIQRENLNVIEEAEAYEYLINKHNLTQLELAQKVGKDRATVANVLRLLQLEPAVRQLVSQDQLSLGQAKVLLSLADPARQLSLAQKAAQESLSVRALEKLVAQSKVQVAAPVLDEDAELRQMLAKDLGEELQKLVGSKVGLDYAQGKGKLTIHFYSDLELNQIADRLREAWQK